MQCENILNTNFVFKEKDSVRENFSIEMIKTLGIIIAIILALALESIVLKKLVNWRSLSLIELIILTMSHNTFTASMLSLLFCLAGPRIDVESNHIIYPRLPPERAEKLRRRDRLVREMLRKRPGILALALVIVLALFSLERTGYLAEKGVKGVLELFIMPHTYLEALGFYIAIREAVKTWIHELPLKRMVKWITTSAILLFIAAATEFTIAPYIDHALT